MDLKIKDVAELLSVSETTVRRWLTEGKIPAYRLNHQYRFSRIEIENWMMRCKLTDSHEEKQIYPPLKEQKAQNEQAQTRSGVQHFALYRAINQGDVLLNIPGRTKEELIRGTTKVIAPKLNVDAEVLAELLLDREKLMPTALNHGIAVPHTRDFLQKGPFDLVFVVIPEAPIEYGALDGLPVHTLFFLFSCADKRHLHLLAKLAHLGSTPPALAFLQSRPDKKRLLEFIKDWESKLTQPGEST